MKHHLKLLFCFFIVPGLPSNVALTSESEESIVVNIKPPAPEERNGVIIGYTVFYRQTKLLPNTDFLSVNTSNSTLRLFNLTVFTEYSIKAAVHTSVGQGKTSPTKTIFTQEGGMSIRHMFNVIVIAIVT